MVRVEPKVQELATLRTEMVMMELNTEGRPCTPASTMASTKGEAFVSEPPDPSSRSEFEGTIRPTMNRVTT